MGRLFEGLVRNTKMAAPANPAKVANVGPSATLDSQDSRLSQGRGFRAPEDCCACLTVWRMPSGRFALAGADHDLSREGATLVSRGDAGRCGHG